MRHLPHDECGSSDALGVYADGSGFCWSCKKYVKDVDKEEVLQEQEGAPLDEERPKEAKKVLPINGDFRALADRGISQETAKKYQVFKHPESYFSWAYPLFKGGLHIANKFRVAEKKGFSVDGEFNQSELFGQNVFPAGSAKQITLTEGYEDAMAAYEMQGSKYPCVSIHSASTAAHDVARNFEYLNAFEEIVICFDKDTAKVGPDGSAKYPGQEAALQVAGMFPLGKVRILTLARAKDANDYLKQGLSKAFVDEWWKAAKYTPAGLKLPKDMWDSVSAKRNTESVPYPWESLNEYTYGIRLSEWVLFTAETGVGKALSLDTPIPTPSGWTTMGDLKKGDKIFSDTGQICNVTFTTPVQLDRACYEVVFDDGSKVVADEDHNWFTSTKIERDKRLQGKVRTTKEISETLLVNDLRANHAIELADALELPEELLEIPPYTFGAWLGDGSSKADIIWSDDPELIDYVREDGYEVTKTSAPYGYKVHGLRAQLRLLGVLGEKYIPEEYLRSSFNQRLSLFQGLMDTDGYCAVENKTCEFTSVNNRLANNVFELALSLGLKAKFKEGRAMLNGRDCGPKYKIVFTTRLPVFKLGRKLIRLPTNKETTSTRRYIKSVNRVDSVPVRCIQVDSASRMFLCGKEMIPTHNTSVVKECEWAILQQFLKQKVAGKLGLLHLEEANEDTLLGLMSITADRPLHLPDVRENTAEEELKRYFNDTCDNDGMVIWDHFGSNSIQEVLNKIRHMNNLGCKYIFFDHLSIVVSDQSGDERKQLDEISTKLKTLCMELDIAVIGVIHQNRQGSIRGSAAPEQLANMVIKLSRDIESEDPWRRNVTKMVIQKNRFCGKTGPCTYLEYIPESGRLVELTREQVVKYESGASEVEQPPW